MTQRRTLARRSKRLTLSRRTVLRGLGTALALPLLESMVPARLLAAEAPAGPRRLAFFFIPNGAHMPDWTPAEEGSSFELPPTLASLADVRDYVLVPSGLAQQKADANGDGPGDHARSAATFLTGRQAYKTDGANIKIGVSVDQVAAQAIGQQTRLPSLELGCDAGANSGNCDSGYSCAYSANISWKTESTPMAKEINPRGVFERLFGNQSRSEEEESRDRRARYRASILDFVLEDARRLQDGLSQADRRKMDEYLTAVRELEGRIERAEQESASQRPPLAQPDGIPGDYGEHIRLMGDLLAVAFQADLTRVATFMLANEGSNRSYPFIDVTDGHHDLSHHGGDEDKQEKIARINRFHLEQFAYFCNKLREMREGEGNLLDQSLILLGSGIGDGNAHNHDELPAVLVGRGGGTIDSGRHIRYDRGTPMANLYLSLLERMGVEEDALGDSTGKLGGLTV
jgi:hypothetical protein